MFHHWECGETEEITTEEITTEEITTEEITTEEIIKQITTEDHYH